MRSNQNKLTKVVGKKEKVTAKELKEANYLKKDITRYDGKTKCKDDKTYVNVYKYGISDYSYTAYLTCPDDRIAAEEEKKEKPKIEAVFPGSKDDVATASIKITFNGEENNPDTKLLSYSYSVFVHDDYQKDNRVGYSSSVSVACEHSCKIAGQHGTYANG